jgi:hypothetical protein
MTKTVTYRTIIGWNPVDKYGGNYKQFDLVNIKLFHINLLHIFLKSQENETLLGIIVLGLSLFLHTDATTEE